MELSKSDLHFVLSRCPRDILKMLKEHERKLFLAGGFIRSTIAGEKTSDVDLFGPSQEFLLQVAKDITLERKGRYFATKNAYTVLAPPRFPVQLITRWVFDDPQRLILSFDFTVCRAVIWAERQADTTIMKDGKPNTRKNYLFQSAIGEGFYEDLAARRLVYTHPDRVEDAGGSLLRVLKFVKKGYNIQAPSVAGVVARILATLSENGLETEERAEDAGGKTSIRRIKESWATMVVTGLLREVDPLTVIDGVDFVDEHEVVEEEACMDSAQVTVTEVVPGPDME
jgi:hypothetical protein